MEKFEAIRRAMVDCQIRPSDVNKYPIIDAMLTVPREEFVPDSFRELAYAGEHVDIAASRVILDPRTFAKMLNDLDIGSQDVVLDVGSGLGYSAAVVASVADTVVALEEEEELAREAERRLIQHSFHNAVVVNDPLVGGVAQHGPYDAILLQGGVETLSSEIVHQLKEGGRIACIFVDGAVGECKIGIKRESAVSWRSAFNAIAPVLPGFERKESFVF